MATLRLFDASEGEATRTRYHFAFRTQLDGVFYRFEVHYNSRTDRWAIDIRDDLDRALVLGKCLLVSEDLLAPYRHLAVPPGRLFAADSSGGNIDAGRDDLGARVVIHYVEAADG